MKTVVGQVLCMIAEYHLTCVARGPAMTSPILPQEMEMYLPPLADYHCPDNSSVMDVRVRDHKARSLCVGVWLHRIDMELSGEREASGSWIQSRHCRGLLLGLSLIHI